MFRLFGRPQSIPKYDHSVRDAANLMAAAAGEFGAPLRQRSLEARKSLLECATGIVENAGHPFKVQLS